VLARPSGIGRLDVSKIFGSEESKMKSGGRRNIELGLSAFVRNFGFSC
jgi:hypothetical protein